LDVSKTKPLRSARLIVAGALVAALSGAGARAQEAQTDSPMKSVMKIVGFATDVKPPPEFVQQSRPSKAPPSIPAFNKAPEPPGAAKSAQEVGDIDSDLEAIGKQHDALRAAFPPSAKAVADAEAAKAAKAKSKSAQKSPIPSF
jgi:hypothetical protein